MAFLQYNLPGSSITGDVSEPTGNYHNENSIHKLTAVPNFLLPSASKSRSPNAAIRTIAQQVEGELGKQGMTSLGDGITKTHRDSSAGLCPAVWGAHRHPLAVPAAGIGATAPLGPPWECLGMPDPQGSEEHRSDQDGSCACTSCYWRSETRPRQQTRGVQCPGSQETCVWELLDSCLPQSRCFQSQRMGWGGNAAVLTPNPCHSAATV